MLLAGDEVLKPQQGNNNGYCQNNELTWFDWNIAGKNYEILQFVRRMIALRKRRPSLMRRRFLNGEKPEEREIPDVSWHGMRINEPLWDDREARVLAFTLAAMGNDDKDLHIMLNMSDTKVDMELPVLKNRYWSLSIDTSRNFPYDAILPENQTSYNKHSYPVETRTIAVMESSLDHRHFLQKLLGL
jgi:glycogen operon protein